MEKHYKRSCVGIIFLILLVDSFQKQATNPFRYKIKYDKNRLVKTPTGGVAVSVAFPYKKPTLQLSKIKKTTVELTNEEISIRLRALDESLAFCNTVDLREITIMDLQKAMTTKHITSLNLVQCYKARIEAMNPYLRAVIELNPDAERIARKLDENREAGILNGPLHGIPVLIKDNIATGDMMDTTAGSMALVGIKPRDDAEIVKRLRRAGAIILGKSNLSEFACFRGTTVPNGWSSRGNLTRNAYVISKDPDGSSSGSAVAVAANLIPVALGTETDGSIIDPSTKGSLVGLKPSTHRIPNDGVIPISFSQDVVGPMTRTVADAAVLFHVISKHGFKDSCFNIKSGLENCAIHNLRVGVLRNPNWESAEVQYAIPEMEKILKVLRRVGVIVIDPVESSPGTLSTVTRESEILVFLHEFKYGINNYLQKSVVSNQRNVNGLGHAISSLDDIIEFNRRFPVLAGSYDQDMLIRSSKTDGIFNKTYLAEREKNIGGAKLYVNYIIKRYSLDAIIVPSTNSSQIPAVAGYPILTFPVGYDAEGLPFGLSLYGLNNSDEVLLQLAYLIEKNLAVRKPPSFRP